MKMRDLVVAVPVLQKVAAERLSLKTLYRVSKLLSVIDRELAFYNAERKKIITLFGNNVQNDKWEIPLENKEIFQEKMLELDNLDIDARFEPVKLPTSETLQLSYNEIKLLRGFIELDDV